MRTFAAHCPVPFSLCQPMCPIGDFAWTLQAGAAGHKLLALLLHHLALLLHLLHTLLQSISLFLGEYAVHF